MSDPVVMIDGKPYVPAARLDAALARVAAAEATTDVAQQDLEQMRLAKDRQMRLVAEAESRAGRLCTKLTAAQQRIAELEGSLTEWTTGKRQALYVPSLGAHYSAHQLIADLEAMLAGTMIDRVQRAESERDTAREELAKVTAERDEWKAGCNVRDGQLAKLDAALGVPTHTSWSELAEAGEKLRSDLTQARAESARLTREVEAMREVVEAAKELTVSWRARPTWPTAIGCRLWDAVQVLSNLQSTPGGEETSTCDECGGDGYIDVTGPDIGAGQLEQTAPCPNGCREPAEGQPPEQAPDEGPESSKLALILRGLAKHAKHIQALESRLSKLEQRPRPASDYYDTDEPEVEARPNEASPLPWRVGDPDADASVHVMAANGTFVGRFLMRRDAAFIIACANRAKGNG